MRKLVVGNWKMNGTSADIGEIALIADAASRYSGADCGICLPATLIERASSAFPNFSIGGQDCHVNDSGAHTGCVSAAMLVDAGAVMSIVGHSERRSDNHETNADVRGKAIAAMQAGLSVIVCVGETLLERDAGKALEIVLEQLEGSLPDICDGTSVSVAYEPVWAIGTGRIPKNSDVAEMHGAIRHQLMTRFGDAGHAIRILYGGSMNSDNAAMLLSIANVDGGLIGGASLTVAKFEPILAAAE